MIKLIPYDASHMDLFAQTEGDIERYGKVSKDMINPMADHGISFTAIDDGRILVIGGILQTTDNTGYCWTMVSEYAAGYGISILRVIKSQMENMMRDMNLHRLETANIASANLQHKWCRLLGFQQEGVMKYYDDKKRTYIRFAKYMED